MYYTYGGNTLLMKTFLSIVISLLVGIVGTSLYFVYFIDETSPTNDGASNDESPPANGMQNELTLITYSNPQLGFSFQYPSLLNLSRRNNFVALEHHVDERHDDPCDLAGFGVQLDTLTDFYVEMAPYATPLEETVRNLERVSVEGDFFENGKLKLSEGFIDRISFGTNSGYRITKGVEGCGEYTYYFPFHSGTMFVKRKFIPELSPVIGNYQQYLSLPDIIKPEDEDTIFRNIMTSLKAVAPSLSQ